MVLQKLFFANVLYISEKRKKEKKSSLEIENFRSKLVDTKEKEGSVMPIEFLNRLQTIIEKKEYKSYAILTILYNATGKRFLEKEIYNVLMENTGDDVFSYRIQNLYHLFMGDGPVFETLFLEEIKDAKRRQQEASF